MVKVIEDIAGQKRKRYNKNKKKAWRKKVEIKEVEEKLEEERREERYGGPLEEREDTELLFLDIGDSGEKAKPVKFAVDTRPGQLVGFKKSTHKRPMPVLRSHQHLKGLQGAKTPHKAKATESKVNAVLKQVQNKAKVQAKKKNLQARYQKHLKDSKANKKPKDMKLNYKLALNWNTDAWSDDNHALIARCKKNGVDDEYVDGIVDFFSKITKTHQLNVPKWRYKQTSSLPAVQVPEPGQSYNPSYKDHQLVLEKAIKQEMKRRKLTYNEKRALEKMFPTVDEAPTEQTWMTEMSEGLPTGEPEEEDSEEENKDTKIETTVTGKRATEKKTKKKRKKERKQKSKEKGKLRVKERHVREGNIYRLKTYKKEINESEKLLRNRETSRKAYQEQKLSKPHRLGKVKYEPEEIAVSLGSDLKGSLRKATPAVCLLEERFKNYQRRNLIEARAAHKGEKRRGKTVMKREHRTILEAIQKGTQYKF